MLVALELLVCKLARSESCRSDCVPVPEFGNSFSIGVRCHRYSHRADGLGGTVAVVVTYDYIAMPDCRQVRV